MAEKEDDRVVHEIDVYLSKSLADNLYVFQYPVRPASMTYEDVTHLGARIKPKQQKIELELAVNTSSTNYATSKGEQIAMNVDGYARASGGTMYYTSDKMDKQVLTSTTVSDAKNYAVGLLKDNELHLTPIHSIVQLRPSFNYLDEVDVKQKQQTADAGEFSQDEEAEEAKPVMVRFARAETSEAKARRLASFNYLQKQRESERWLDMRYYPNVKDDICEQEKLQLLCKRQYEETQFLASPEDYLQMLLPEATQLEEEKPALPSNVLSLSQLKTMTLNDQIKALLTSAKTIQFSRLMSLLPKGTDQTAALRSLQQVAMCVQGCWVVKSETLYRKDSYSAHSGAPAEVLCRGRDYVMWKFTQNRYLVRKDITSIIKLAPEDVKEILEQMSRIRVNQGWEFLLEFDKDFVDRHPDVVERQGKLWELKYQQLLKTLKSTKTGDEGQSQQIEKPKRRRTASRSRTKSGDISLSDLSDTDTDKMQQTKSDQRHSRSGSGHGVKEENCDNLPNHIFETASHTDNRTIQNGDVEMIATPSVKLQTELVNFVQEKLYSRYVLTLSELRRLFGLKLAQCQAGHVLGTGVSDKLLEQTILEVGGVHLKNQWPPTSTEEPLFALVKTGDKMDNIRSVMLSMFSSAYRIKSTILKKNIEEKNMGSPSESEIKKILKDYCVTRGGMWYLKGTSPDS